MSYQLPTTNVATAAVNADLELTLEETRRQYRRIRKAVASWAVSPADFDLWCKQQGAETPAEFLRTARRWSAGCERCNATGIYSWGACINGKMQFSGNCYQCNSTGHITPADCARNYHYACYAIRKAFNFG